MQQTVREDRQAGITTVALFLFVWRACMFVRRLPLAASSVSVCLSRLLAACCLLLARCEYVCCLCVRERHASKQMRVDVDRRLISVGVRVWQDRLRGICNVGSR